MSVLIEARNLNKRYVVRKHPFARKKIIRAVDDVSLEIRENESLGLIGESGSGKTTAGRLILNLTPRDSGQVFFRGEDLALLNERQWRSRRRDMQIIFQNAASHLDPMKTVRQAVEEPLRLHGVVPGDRVAEETFRLLELVGLDPAVANRRPLEFSGGQQQRIGIARAIASRPAFIVCDEPVSALDVSVQGQIINLLADLKEQLKMTYLFISHDLNVVGNLCDRIAVMYRGRIIETGPTRQVLEDPREAYTRELVDALL